MTIETWKELNAGQVIKLRGGRFYYRVASVETHEGVPVVFARLVTGDSVDSDVEPSPLYFQSGWDVVQPGSIIIPSRERTVSR